MITLKRKNNLFKTKKYKCNCLRYGRKSVSKIEKTMRNKEAESGIIESIMDSKYTTAIEEDGEKRLALIGSDEGIHEINCSSNMGSILREFTKLYTDKLDRLSSGGEDELKRKVSVLECWINDLGDQNSILVSTVEELEREASRRVSLLQEELEKMAVVTKESCVSFRDHQLEVSTLVKQKVSAEEEVITLQEKILDRENTNASLLRENSELRQDLDNILEVITRARMTGRWVCDDFNFKSLRPEQILRPRHFSTFGNLDSEGEGGLSGFQDGANSDASEGEQDSVVSTLSFDTDRKTTTISKLKSEIKRMKESQLETHAILNQRDAHIVDLQSELTNLNEKLDLAQSQVENTSLTLQTLMDRGRHDSLEICRRDEMIRQLLSPSHFKGEMFKPSGGQIDLKSKLDVEVQLSGNIDIMSMRLAELEEECQRLRHQNDCLKSALSMRSLSEDRQEDNFAIAYTPNSIPPSRKVDSQLQVELASKQVQTEKVSPGGCDRSEMKTNEQLVIDSKKIGKLENELSEKNILIRELQNHLIISREELQLKDDTLHNIEQKLDSTRRKYDDKEERMHYLTSQLTNLQLELSRLHGTTQYLRSQLEVKSELVHKLESENRSLVRQFNDKSSLFERMERDHSQLMRDMDWRKKEAAKQKATIGTLQDALTSTKRTYDRLSTQYNNEEHTWGGLFCTKGNPCQTGEENHYCSCRRNTSFELQSSFKNIELKRIIEELSIYLKEAEKMVKILENEHDDLIKELCSDHNFHLREAQRQKESFEKLRTDSVLLISKLNEMKQGLSKCSCQNGNSAPLVRKRVKSSSCRITQRNPPTRTTLSEKEIRRKDPLSSSKMAEREQQHYQEGRRPWENKSCCRSNCC